MTCSKIYISDEKRIVKLQRFGYIELSRHKLSLKSFNWLSLMSLKKMLLYRSTHRGCKELDIIIGEFAQNTLDDLAHNELLEYEQLLQADDTDLYNWITTQTQPPQFFANSVLKRLTAKFANHF